jgi:glutathione-specific gamma-glutamylcyclotransferase
MAQPKVPPLALTAELVALCERPIADPGRQPGITYLNEEDYTAAAHDLHGQNGDGPFWIFAYGSLIWNPGFDYVEERRGVAHGWHRQFSMKLTHWRGTPEQPGLMLALEHGGSCDGILFRLPPGEEVAQLEKLLFRETDRPEDLSYLRWLNVRTAEGLCRALVFWAHPKGLHLPEPPTFELAAHMLARACGHMGSGASYLFKTVSKLAEYGILDRNLWRLQEMVAHEIMALQQTGEPRLHCPPA